MADLANFRRQVTLLAGVMQAQRPEVTNRLFHRLIAALEEDKVESNFALLSGAADQDLLVYNSGSGLWTPGTGITNLGISGTLSVVDIAHHAAGRIGEYGTSPQTKPTIVGAKGGNVALANLLTALAARGSLTDNTT